MNYLTSKIKMLTMIGTLLALLIQIQACEKDGLLNLDNNKDFLSKLSEYKIFQGNPSDLLPTSDFNYYEISTTLFTDYAEKQRLIKIPKGSSLRASDDYLPDFPDGTMIVKTFYYFNDKRDPSKGKKIIETRLLIKSGATWNYGTYLWNESQTEAHLITTGLNETQPWFVSSRNNFFNFNNHPFIIQLSSAKKIKTVNSEKTRPPHAKEIIYCKI